MVFQGIVLGLLVAAIFAKTNAIADKLELMDRRLELTLKDVKMAHSSETQMIGKFTSVDKMDLRAMVLGSTLL